MKKRTKRLLILAAALLLAGLWVWRYVTLNAYYDSLVVGESQELYAIGEMVPFGTDYFGNRAQAEGYFIRVDSLEIVDVEDFDPAYENPTDADKLALVTITLYNEDSDAEGIMLNEFKLYGVDTLLHMDWDALMLANPALEGNLGISLGKGQEVQVVLPYCLIRNFFSASTWRNLENRAWYLNVTYLPTEKNIQVNGGR